MKKSEAAEKLANWTWTNGTETRMLFISDAVGILDFLVNELGMKPPAYNLSKGYEWEPEND